MLTHMQQNFRNAMAKLGAAVNVVTTNGVAGKCGITATAVCSITDTPPIIMVCINTESRMNSVLKKNQRMCVNILTSTQQDLAEHFAGFRESSMDERFLWDIWYSQEQNTDVPMLKEALVNMCGKVVDQREMGTHTVFFLELEDIIVNENDKQGLIYFNRAFQTLTDLSGTPK